MLMRALTIVLVTGLLPVTTFVSSVSAQDFGADSIYQLQQLQDEVRQLRGLVEQQQRELDRLRERQRDQYLDLDTRIQNLGAASGGSSYNSSGGVDTAGSGTPAFVGAAPGAEANRLPGVDSVPVTNSGPAVLPGAAASSGQTNTRPSSANSDPATDLAALGEPEVRGEINTQATITTLNQPQIRSTGTSSVTAGEQAEYDAAFAELKALRYERAADGFRNFIARYPESRLADNAQYWLGESYYGARNFSMALQAFQQLLDRYPDSGKRADALLKVGYSHYELRQWPAARAALEQVQAQYPDSTIARLAENRLRTMRLEGHF